MEALPSATKDTTVGMVAVTLGALSKSPLANFVSQSSRGGFDAACQLINQLERDLPIRDEGHTGPHWAMLCCSAVSDAYLDLVRVFICRAVSYVHSDLPPHRLPQKLCGPLPVLCEAHREGQKRQRRADPRSQGSALPVGRGPGEGPCGAQLWVTRCRRQSATY